MSWNAYSTDAIDKDEIDSISGLPQNSPEGVEDAYDDQFAAALEAAAILAKAIGGDDTKVSVSMSGHANPNHEPYPGFADEMITVSVRM